MQHNCPCCTVHARASHTDKYSWGKLQGVEGIVRPKFKCHPLSAAHVLMEAPETRPPCVTASETSIRLCFIWLQWLRKAAARKTQERVNVKDKVFISGRLECSGRESDGKEIGHKICELLNTRADDDGGGMFPSLRADLQRPIADSDQVGQSKTLWTP